MFMRTLKSGLTALALTLPTIAAALESPVTLTVLEGWRQADGTHVAALRFDLEKDWKTYWRKPGDAGIPPLFDLVDSVNFSDFAVKWPAPVVFDQAGYTSVGYKDQLILPIVITPRRKNQDVHLRGAVQIGVCQDVCLPVTLEISARLDARTKDETPIIAAALASVPMTAAEAGVKSAVCKLGMNGSTLTLSTILGMPPTGGDEFVILESANRDLWISDTQSTRKGDELTARGEVASMSGTTIALNRSEVRITVLGQDRAVDIQGCTGR